MKKIISAILSISLSAGLISGTTIKAEDLVTVELDGKKIEFDVNPEIIDGRTMVPLRKIFEEIGALVKWNGDTQTISARKNSKTITLSVNSSDLQIDKGKTDDEGNPIVETVSMEVPAQIIDGRTLVPARVISESFGLDVEWDEDKHNVVITSDEEEDDSWKENTGSVNLSDLTFEGEGIEISDNLIKITAGGDFTLKGTLKNGNITISTKEKVKLRLSGVNITSSENPCIFVEDADKAYITLTDGTENILTAEKCEDGAIYSKENLEIKGDGSLDIKSPAGHGIKASDNLNIENGNIKIDASTDGIHINDTFKMSGGNIDITAVCDGIDSESIINISGGKINIETNGTPLETTTDSTAETQRRGMWEDAADVEFEKSTKGINAEWMLSISGGDISINSASHAIHCQDEIEINGGSFSLSSKYDKGISAHGNLNIGGENTNIDITKSTEGLESKNVMTINDGVIKVVSSDDAINATGGNSGMMMPGGNFGRNNENGEFTPPEGFGRNRQNTEKDAENNEAQPQQRQRPPRQRNNNNQNSEAQNGEFRFPFGNNENGEFPHPFGNNENGKNPFENAENGEFKFPFGNNENGENTPPFGNRPQPNPGDMFPGGGMGGMGMGRNMKNCLTINGGYLELCGNDDCIDTNGNMTINGGTIKASNPTGSFTGNFGVLDGDGQIITGENANIILTSASGNEKSLKLTQNAIIIYCEKQHTANENISLSDANGNVVYEYAPEGYFKTILIASGNIKTGEKYSVKIGDEVFEAEITQQTTIMGTQPTGNMRFGRRQEM